jgi:hypothetical protein
MVTMRVWAKYSLTIRVNSRGYVMTPIYIARIKRSQEGTLIYDVVRPQRKDLSRYKFKKQAGIIQNIMDDPQIMDIK